MGLDEKLNYLAGEVNGLRAAIFALMEVCPDLLALRAALDQSGEAALSLSNPHPVSEQYLEGQRQAIDGMKTHLREVIAERIQRLSKGA
jgi:hypothetical protein